MEFVHKHTDRYRRGKHHSSIGYLLSLGAFLRWHSLTCRFFALHSACIAMQHDEPIKSIAWLADKGGLITGSWDKTIKFWDPRAGTTPSVRAGRRLARSCSCGVFAEREHCYLVYECGLRFSEYPSSLLGFPNCWCALWFGVTTIAVEPPFALRRVAVALLVRLSHAYRSCYISPWDCSSLFQCRSVSWLWM